MGIVRNYVDLENPVSYVATLAFFCCVSCVVIMLFGGFRAKIKVASKRTKDENVPVVSISGAYRSTRDEFFDSGSRRTTETHKKITPSMVNLPRNNNSLPPVKPSKSTSDVREPGFVPVTQSKSTPDISFDPRGGKNNIPEAELREPQKSVKALKKEEKEKLKLEKRRQAEHKAREKAAQQQAKENAKREKEQARQAKARDKKSKKKTAAPPVPPAPPLPQSVPPQTSSAPTPLVRPNRQPITTSGTLQSSISRTSGPPPYSELPPEPANKPSQPVNVEKANSSNVSFGKPIENTVSSWDMVTQHRQQMNRPTATIGGGARKQMVMDLQYNFNNKTDDDKDNSEV